jgi:hypothetical protein
MKRSWIFLVLFFLVILQINAKTKKFGTWINAEITKDIFKKLEFGIKPELRLQDNFAVDEYLVEGELVYKPVKFLRLGAAYRFSQEMKKSSTLTTHRFSFYSLAKKDWRRLEGSFRFCFSNYSEMDEETQKSNYFRYRLKFSYDLKNSRFMPFTSYELFHSLTEKILDKSRFDIGSNFRISNKSTIGVYYRLQSYFNRKDAIHILGLSYSLDL